MIHCMCVSDREGERGEGGREKERGNEGRRERDGIGSES